MGKHLLAAASVVGWGRTERWNGVWNVKPGPGRDG